MKNLFKIMIIIISLFTYFISYWEDIPSTPPPTTNNNSDLLSSNTDQNNSTNSQTWVNLEEEFKKDWIELNTPSEWSWDKTIIDKANEVKNREFEKLVWKTDEEKNIEALQTVIDELEIKKELNQKQLDDIQSNLKSLQESILENNKNIDLLKNWKNITEISKELADLEKNNEDLKEDLKFKEELVKDLQNSLAWYNLLEAKYKNLLESYVSVKKEKNDSILKEKQQKLVYLFVFIIIFTIIYLIKIVLVNNNNFRKKHENFWEYFDLIFWVSLVIFLVIYIFYLFPELYVLLIFISWSLIFINAQVISSFVASLILFRHFKIWDVIKIWTERWKIIKMNPLSTVIKKINDYWVIENEEMWIPNIDLLKEKVTLAKNSLIKENIFNIILSLKWEKDVFEIVDYIRENILFKMIEYKLTTLNPNNTDTFRTKYEHIDEDKIKITFYWLWTSELNRKIEKKIIQYIKEYLYYNACSTNKKSSWWKNKSNWHDIALQKAVIIEWEVDN